MTQEDASQMPPPPLPPSISFTNHSREDGGRHFFHEWDKYAAEEAQRRNTLPPGLESPRTVIDFFRDLLPDQDEEPQADLDDCEMDHARNASLVKDDVVEEQIQQQTTHPTVQEHVAPATVPPTRPRPKCSEEQLEHFKQCRRKMDASVNLNKIKTSRSFSQQQANSNIEH